MLEPSAFQRVGLRVLSTHVGRKIYTFVTNVDYKLFYPRGEGLTKQAKNCHVHSKLLTTLHA